MATNEIDNQSDISDSPCLGGNIQHSLETLLELNLFYSTIVNDFSI